MLSDVNHSELLASYLEQIEDADAKEAYIYLIGAGATSKTYVCRPQVKGVVRDFRFYEQSGRQPFAFIVNKQSLLFYFRSPAVRSGRFNLPELQALFESASENNSGEWTVRLATLGDAQRLWHYILREAAMFESGTSPSTQIGYVNRNGQRCAGHRGTPGNDHNQVAYRMECQRPGCGHVYGANGSDVFQRRCPKCQGGEPGIAF